MKLKLICCVLYLVLILSCRDNERIYTSEELQKNNDGLNPKGTYFWDEFGSLQKYYDLTDEESEMLGFWTGFEEPSSSDYNFYPNKLLVVFFGLHIFKNENSYLSTALGTWDIRNNIVRATIYGYLKCHKSTDSQPERYEYMGVSPYEITIIDAKYIDPMGYSRKPFMEFTFSKEIRKQIVAPEGYSAKAHMLRKLYTINVITNSGKPEKNYWYFKRVPDMLENGFSGYDIATNPELAYRYFGKGIP
jgi:hypothetical protein